MARSLLVAALVVTLAACALAQQPDVKAFEKESALPKAFVVMPKTTLGAQFRTCFNKMAANVKAPTSQTAFLAGQKHSVKLGEAMTEEMAEKIVLSLDADKVNAFCQATGPGQELFAKMINPSSPGSAKAKVAALQLTASSKAKIASAAQPAGKHYEESPIIGPVEPAFPEPEGVYGLALQLLEFLGIVPDASGTTRPNVNAVATAGLICGAVELVNDVVDGVCKVATSVYEGGYTGRQTGVITGVVALGVLTAGYSPTTNFHAGTSLASPDLDTLTDCALISGILDVVGDACKGVLAATALVSEAINAVTLDATYANSVSALVNDQFLWDAIVHKKGHSTKMPTTHYYNGDNKHNEDDD